MEYFYSDGLESERLVTSYLNESHIPLWKPFFFDSSAMQYFPGLEENSPSENAKIWIDRQIGRYADQLYGLQAIFEKSTGQFVGQCGLITQNVDDAVELEVGYHILSPFRGQGYAPEAARLFFNFGFQHSPQDSLISIIKRNNLPSQRVAAKNGLVRDSETYWRNIDVYIYRVKRTDWMASKP
ncbi:MAG: GNAT family N-acetyltransferase [Bacteroidetes bacterium]|nr:GNAT family N-acetyltransferase [Bacteroidota bacterium]